MQVDNPGCPVHKQFIKLTHYTPSKSSYIRATVEQESKSISVVYL